MKRSTSPHFEILAAPIGDVALHLLKQLEEVGSVDPQVALHAPFEAMWSFLLSGAPG